MTELQQRYLTYRTTSLAHGLTPLGYGRWLAENLRQVVV